MIIPEYWAEAKVKYRKGNRRITIQRFGWSDISQEDAQKEAEKRAEQALQDWQEGKIVKSREKKIYYNGADGLPIREQIISKHNDIVITRNSYGALCLNTPDVMFADIDIEYNQRYLSDKNDKIGCLFSVIALIALITLFILLVRGEIISVYTVIAAIIFIICFFINKILDSKEAKRKANWLKADQQRAQQYQENQKTEIMKNIHNFCQTFPQWGIRIYKTPAGLRLLITHQTFDPTDEQVTAFFGKMGVDSLYSIMCKNQRCFRARVSPKPWRINMPNSISSSHRVWPFSPNHTAERQKWLVQYEEKAKNYASCQFIEAIGNSDVDSKAAQVIELHDQLSQANKDLPIA